MTQEIAYPAEMPPHPRAADPPHGAIWRRGGRRRFEPVPRAHAELVVLLGLSGQAEYLLDGRLIRFGRGGMIWALAGQAHRLIRESAGFDMWVVLAGARLGAEVPLRCGDGRAGLSQITAPAMAELEALAGQVAGDTAKGLGLCWWLHRARQHWEAGTRDRAGARLHPAVARAALLIEAEPDLSLAQVSDRAGLSAGQLRRVFRSEMGQSLAAFRRAERLRQVDVAVAEGADMTRAALEAGWGSYAQFFRDFRAARGMAPRDWFRTRE